MQEELPQFDRFGRALAMTLSPSSALNVQFTTSTCALCNCALLGSPTGDLLHSGIGRTVLFVTRKNFTELLSGRRLQLI